MLVEREGRLGYDGRIITGKKSSDIIAAYGVPDRIDTVRQFDVFRTFNYQGVFWVKMFNFSEDDSLLGAPTERRNIWEDDVRITHCFSSVQKIQSGFNFRRFYINSFDYVEKPWEYAITDISPTDSLFRIHMRHLDDFKNVEVKRGDEHWGSCGDEWLGQYVFFADSNGNVRTCEHDGQDCRGVTSMF